MTDALIAGVLPVFLIITIGFGLARRGFLDAGLKAGMNRLVYFLCLPLLLFEKTATAAMPTDALGGLMAMVVGGTAIGAAAAYGVARALRLRRASIGAFVHAGFRGNLVFLALPIVLYTIRALPAADREALEAATILAVVPTVVLYNMLAVIVLLAHGTASGARHPFGAVAAGIARNPLIIASVMGLAVRVCHLPAPTLILRTCEIMGGAAFPLALVCIGYELAATPVAGIGGVAFVAAGIKLLALPFIGLLLARVLGVGPWPARIGLLLLASPTAVASYVLTEQLDGDAPLAANVIVVTTLFSLVTFSVLALLPV